jgi:hypothetical protein
VQFIRDHGDGHLKADKIFRSFIEAAEELGQEATPPVTTLEDAYQVCLQGGEQKLARKMTNVKLYTRLVGPHPLFRLSSRNSVWRRFRYSTYGNQCVGFIPVVPNWRKSKPKTDPEVECYLYQLLLIFEALRKTKWISRELTSTTVSSTWSELADHLIDLILGSDHKLQWHTPSLEH